MNPGPASVQPAIPLAFRLKALLKALPGWYALRGPLDRSRQRRDHEAWLRAGSPLPPPHMAKRLHLQEIARRHGLAILVETGTYYGEMIQALRGDFARLCSIELSPALHALARRRFAGDPRIEILQGDSGERLRDVVPTLDRPTLFWLDGHWSSGLTAGADTDAPVLRELDHILDGPDLGHAIVIDDARDFGSDPAYPTIEQVRAHVAARRPGLEFRHELDSLVFTPRPD